MSGLLVGFVGLIYLVVMGYELASGRYGNALMFFGYALANLGIIYQTLT